MQYVFTAVFTKDLDGSILVSFPDIPGCYSQGQDMLEAARRAEEVLSYCLFDMEKQGIPIPTPRYPDMIETKEGEVISIVLANTGPHHEFFADKTVRHTVTLPTWLGQIVEDAEYDLSRLLQDAIKREVGMPVYKPIAPLPPYDFRPPGPENGTSESAIKPRPRSGEVFPDNRSPGKTKANTKFVIVILVLIIFLAAAAGGVYLVTQTNILYDVLGIGAPVTRTPEFNTEDLIDTLEQARTEVEGEQYDSYTPFNDSDYADTDASAPEEAEAAGDTSQVLALRQEYGNSEIIGFIEIPGADIRYPVAQGVDDEFYLTHDIFGAPSDSGWIFVESWLDMVNLPNNTVIYGGSAPDGGLFSNLAQFADYDFFSQNLIINFNTLYGDFQWEVFSFYTDGSQFAFSHANERNWGSWIESFAERSNHPSNVTVYESDRIITLITDAVAGDGYRYVLHARLI